MLRGRIKVAVLNAAVCRLDPCSLECSLCIAIYSYMYGTQYVLVDRDSSVGVVTRYGLDGSGIECRWGRDFPHLCRPALGPTQPPVR